MKLKKAWYVLLYHDVSWELSSLNVSIGGTITPDIFRNHISIFSQIGDLVSIEDGLKLTLNQEIKSPLISLWFDDGMKGVRKNAFDIINNYFNFVL